MTPILPAHTCAAWPGDAGTTQGDNVLVLLTSLCKLGSFLVHYFVCVWKLIEQVCLQLMAEGDSHPSPPHLTHVTRQPQCDVRGVYVSLCSRRYSRFALLSPSCAALPCSLISPSPCSIFLSIPHLLLRKSVFTVTYTWRRVWPAEDLSPWLPVKTSRSLKHL